ncbi:FAH family protein [Paraburkholderia aspalathi]|nr:FAH family protein [Paraburkholderia aspalathi]
MTIRLVQLKDNAGARQVALALEDHSAVLLDGITSTYELAWAAIERQCTLKQLIDEIPHNQPVDIALALSESRVLAPIDHRDPAHLLLTGTGLTHLGSAEGRDKMHKAAASTDKPTDSMRMFQWGVEGGKPAQGETGAQPEWFYKGDGSCIQATGQPLISPHFAQDGGEEPEIAAIYIIGPDGTPFRLGFALANEFSDHVIEKQNYLWLAHSKLRPAALGPELRTGALPGDINGMSRIIRDGQTLWEKPFVSGETNMSHSIDNLEQHHFKYDLFRRPGDVHVHFFGTATLSFSDNIQTQDGDVFEIEATSFLYPLRNMLAKAEAKPLRVSAL